ncbi:MAG TPA: DUF4105 domain-containing protein [Alphaproteobacteria bacterium]|nr:DUF4105 domain-containing protein [Alphaproteobacteria bacterium]
MARAGSVPLQPKRAGGLAVHILSKSLFVLAILAVGGWTELVLLYAPVLSGQARLPAALAVAMLALLALAGVFLRRLRPAILALGVAAALATVAWALIEPSHAGNWPPEVARMAEASIEGDRVTIRNIRNFDWNGTDRFLERWEERSYSLSALSRLDLIASYWGGPHIAHLMVSFGFDTGEQIIASIEIRRRRDQEYSTLQGAFRNYELIYILGDERDLLRLRTTFRKERVHLFRLRTPPENARRLFLEYLRTINALAQRPRFYNTLWTNCTSQIRVAGLAAGAVLPWDWRLLLTGHTPEYLYARGSPDTRLPFEELQNRAQINEAADRAGKSPLFSILIRENLPDPLR